MIENKLEEVHDYLKKYTIVGDEATLSKNLREWAEKTMKMFLEEPI